ncbi:DUF6415 family natural product biosynthesis protein [Streptomyces cylindrosporus]|uniref:DUF6415 family natural product biosynthesis protein n=1 Tax=Streptomyces cylindrosporus TaxID=2927583 RepID=A0ABS9XYS0_9ACTN|nr:DUF6415 family natural product biosynthesis protein [Streptomyces cylindrosporus]MCI3270117.1 DUF6415 family natural product biosynthesis protein [Streptomyces cylindrosporus]
MGDDRSLEFDACRSAWTEALELTNGLPAKVPDRAEVDRLAGCLRGHVAALAGELGATLEAQSADTSERETARWLLVRTHRTLNEGPDLDHRAAAVHLEDLALNCRALIALCHQQVCAQL